MAPSGVRACGVPAGIVSIARVIEASHANQHVRHDHRMRSIPRFPASELRLAVRQAVHYEPRDFIAVEGQEQWACLLAILNQGDRGNQANWQNP
jgi:hypothetical protein